ncbi:sulfotransferase family protein [Marimonas lutisalis]|uniref:sulfotransferase family protein n=1 Tax=Marimonas lutisalis TaxID=2545756 RepID=UPI0010F8730D|nr:sulfotransferase [Marimonas lutisalis]
MKNPNFFIAGAPKSGTTAMADYLDDHEEVFVCKPKEPCFFSNDFPGQQLVSTPEAYSALFQEAGPHHKAVGEGSVWYLYSRVALENIRQYDPDARIIVMLRNPVEQVYSMHQELFHRRYETQSDFMAAWNMQSARHNGHGIPKYCKEARFLQYSAIAEYAAQIARLKQIFPDDQVKIILFDDFKRDTRQAYLDVLAFLGVRDDGRTDFVPSLESRRHRLHWLGTFLINQPSWLISARNRFKKVLGIKRIGLRDIVAKHNTVVEKRAPLPPEFIQELKDHFRSDVEQLSRMIGRDLSHWCR